MNQRNVPGIDNAYLAMDTEEGVEVVWNEVMFSERKNFKLQEVGAELGQCSKIQQVFALAFVNTWTEKGVLKMFSYALDALFFFFSVTSMWTCLVFFSPLCGFKLLRQVVRIVAAYSSQKLTKDGVCRPEEQSSCYLKEYSGVKSILSLLLDGN